MTDRKMALSIDVEDWFTVRNMREFFDFNDWSNQELRINVGMDFILEELNKRNIKATFFVLGWIAEKCPELILKISSEGHEIASHGYSHTPIDLLTPETFEEDLKKSIEVISTLTGKPVKGFRAPSFSITKETLWAIDILKRNGIEYDSSIFSTVHPDYGIRNFPTKITDMDGLTEVPMRKGKFFGMNIPVNGGGYFRMLPYSMIKSSLKQTLKGDSLVMYFHPWEFDPTQPKIGLSQFKKFRHYVGLNSNRDKFIKLLNDFKFTTMEELIESEKSLAPFVKATAFSNAVLARDL
jgi:polysaccharide deacetylase family protein (PEP-CTERM system associated)